MRNGDDCSANCNAIKSLLHSSLTLGVQRRGCLQQKFVCRCSFVPFRRRWPRCVELQQTQCNSQPAKEQHASVSRICSYSSPVSTQPNSHHPYMYITSLLYDRGLQHTLDNDRQAAQI